MNVLIELQDIDSKDGPGATMRIMTDPLVFDPGSPEAQSSQAFILGQLAGNVIATVMKLSQPAKPVIVDGPVNPN